MRYVVRSFDACIGIGIGIGGQLIFSPVHFVRRVGGIGRFLERDEGEAARPVGLFVQRHIDIVERAEPRKVVAELLSQSRVVWVRGEGVRRRAPRR
jgi:hypothetical protein